VKVRRAYLYRLYPDRGQSNKLDWTLNRCRELYNAALEERREAYRMCGISVGYYDQKRQLPAIKEVRPEYKQIGSQVLQDVTARLDKAFQAFFKRVRQGVDGKKIGYPRFKGRYRYNSFTLSQTGWKLDKRLYVAGIGHDAAWGQFLAILQVKAEEAGLVYVAVNPGGTSQHCSGCGAKSPKTLADRWHTCTACGLSLQRDHNAALNILNRAGLAPCIDGMQESHRL